MKSDFKIFQPSPEDRAYIYQQIQDLQAFVGPSGQVAVVCEKGEEDSGQVFYAVTLASIQNGAFEVRAKAEDFYEACLKAKESLLKAFEALSQNTDLDQAREVQIRILSQGHLLH